MRRPSAFPWDGGGAAVYCARRRSPSKAQRRKNTCFEAVDERRVFIETHELLPTGGKRRTPTSLPAACACGCRSTTLSFSEPVAGGTERRVGSDGPQGRRRANIQMTEEEALAFWARRAFLRDLIRAKATQVGFSVGLLANGQPPKAPRARSRSSRRGRCRIPADFWDESPRMPRLRRGASEGRTPGPPFCRARRSELKGDWAHRRRDCGAPGTVKREPRCT